MGTILLALMPKAYEKEQSFQKLRFVDRNINTGESDLQSTCWVERSII
jgi:hypothetical protein